MKSFKLLCLELRYKAKAILMLPAYPAVLLAWCIAILGNTLMLVALQGATTLHVTWADYCYAQWEATYSLRATVSILNKEFKENWV